MKNLLYILLFVPLALFGQEITADLFTAPANTGIAMTVGINASKFDQFEGGQIGAFSDLDGNGTLECVGLESISTGFFGLALWGDDSSTPEADGLASGAAPAFAILHDGNVILVAETPQFTGYVTNGIVNITDATLDGGSGCTDEESFNAMFMYSDVTYTDDGSCIPYIYGCTYSWAYNYNPLATADDGSCIPYIYGCIDESAFNYNAEANTDDISCEYIPEECICCGDAFVENFGCTIDCGSSWYTWNPNTNTCSIATYGCMDETAYNFDPDAIFDDGSCEYCFELNCCPGSFNFDPLCELCGCGADDDDSGGCCLEPIYGCQDSSAYNYSPEATEEDGSCEYLLFLNTDYNYNYESPNKMTFIIDSILILSELGIESGDYLMATYSTDYLNNNFIQYSHPTNYIPSGGVFFSNENELIEFYLYGGYYSYELGYEQFINGVSSGEEIKWVLIKGFNSEYNNYSVTLTYDSSIEYDGLFENGRIITITGISINNNINDGCLDSRFMEFNPTANWDDGSCATMISVGCMDANAVNYAGADVDASSIHDNATNHDNVFGDNLTVDLNTGMTSPSGVGAIFHDVSMCQTQVEGCTDAMAINYDPMATQNDATDCDWTLNGMQEYNVDQDGWNMGTDYNFGAVDPENENAGIFGSDFDNAQLLFYEGALNPDAHVIDNLADVMQWIDSHFENISVDLAMGWNMIGYSCIHPISAEVAFEAIVDELQVLKDNNGAIYIPEYGFNGIGDLTPGHGYQLKISTFILDFNICE
jgi:hypothetical protein